MPARPFIIRLMADGAVRQRPATAGMRPRPPIVYLETSAVNLLADVFDSGKPRQIPESTFFISPVTIWEILLTRNAERREHLISFLQRACSPRLLASPSELAVSYIEMGCPRHEPHHDTTSGLSIARTWREVCQDLDRTFIYDPDELSLRGKYMRECFRDLGRVVGRAAAGNPNPHDHLGLLPSLDALMGCECRNGSPKCRYGKRHDIWRLSALMMLFMMCSEADIDPTPVQRFWSRHSLTDIEGRLRFLFTEHPLLVRRGPFAAMAIVAYHQLRSGNSTRGLLWDCLHAPYLVYADLFLTNDEHFTSLNAVAPHVNFGKVRLVRDLLRVTPPP
jgi:hypothetical protein